LGHYQLSQYSSCNFYCEHREKIGKQSARTDDIYFVYEKKWLKPVSKNLNNHVNEINLSFTKKKEVFMTSTDMTWTSPVAF